MMFQNGCIIMCQTSTKYHKIIDVDGLKSRTDEESKREHRAIYGGFLNKFIGSNNSMVSLPFFHALAFQGQSTGGTIDDITSLNTAVREPQKNKSTAATAAT